MSNAMSASHQVSISHDPLEDREGARFNNDRFPRDNWPSGGRRPTTSSSRSTSLLPSIDAADLRPALLAGAIGLFAAWIVSGMSQRSQPQRSRSSAYGGRYVADRDEPRGYQGQRQSVRGPRDGYSEAGPEGRSSREDFVFDAMNP